RLRRKGQGSLVLLEFEVGPKLLARARDSEAFLVQEFLDSQHSFYVLAAVHALPGVALDRLQLRKFCFPKAQNVCGQVAEVRNLSDAEVELVRNDDFVRSA